MIVKDVVEVVFEDDAQPTDVDEDKPFVVTAFLQHVLSQLAFVVHQVGPAVEAFKIYNFFAEQKLVLKCSEMVDAHQVQRLLSKP